jgi:hypothetical protein
LYNVVDGQNYTEIPLADSLVAMTTGRGLTGEEKNDGLERIEKECQWLAEDPPQSDNETTQKSQSKLQDA